LNFANPTDRQALRALLATADIVIEAARPRALLQLGFDATEIVRSTPGLAWITITGHGADNPAADWVGFGDDCGVAGGLSAALHSATGKVGFVGDAIADPLTGIFAAHAAWDAWASGRGSRIGIAMSHVVAHCLAQSTEHAPDALIKQLRHWNANVARPFPPVERRSIAALPAFGAHTSSVLTQVAQC
jgi:crotonobetainyl-CoA:carnitine CoA-transferase CaiB-like acyl-CoA transferase